MAAFSHHHHPFLHHQTTAFHPHSTTNTFSGHQPTTTAAATCLRDQDRHHKNKNLQSQGSSTSMEVDHGSHDHLLAMKRKGNNGISQDTRKGKKKKQKKSSDDEGEIGYIHVRARSGQATNSHSLAERVRRKKINERMKLLQSIVPGCDQVTAKTLMLDQIINYVHSLQNQVEFLSMKLASANPMLCEFEVGLDAFRSHQNMNDNMALPFISNVQQYKPTHIEGGNCFTTTDSNFHHPIDSSTPNIHPKVLWDLEKQIGVGNNSFN